MLYVLHWFFMLKHLKFAFTSLPLLLIGMEAGELTNQFRYRLISDPLPKIFDIYSTRWQWSPLHIHQQIKKLRSLLFSILESDIVPIALTEFSLLLHKSLRPYFPSFLSALTTITIFIITALTT